MYLHERELVRRCSLKAAADALLGTAHWRHVVAECDGEQCFAHGLLLKKTCRCFTGGEWGVTCGRQWGVTYRENGV